MQKTSFEIGSQFPGVPVLVIGSGVSDGTESPQKAHDVSMRGSGFENDVFESTIFDELGLQAPRDILKGGWKTYNFEVEHLHTYVAEGVRVHNDSGFLGMIGDDFDNHFFDKLGRVGDAVGDVVKGAFHAVGQVVGGVVDAVKAIGNGFNAAGEKFQNGDILGGIGEIGKGIGKAIGEVVEGIVNAVGEVVKGIGEAIGSVFGKNDSNDGHSDDRGKPVILDLDGDGVEISVDGNVSFDMDGDGYLEKTNWVSSDDAFLVIDLNADGTRGAGDGKIDQTKEVVFTKWLDWDGATDLQALATFDQSAERGGNNDGVLNAQDGVWSELRSWQDINQNGVADRGELKTLAQLGISEIKLTYDDGTHFSDMSNDIEIFSNTLLGSASFIRNGKTVKGGLGDVALSYKASGWREVTENGVTRIEFENGTNHEIHLMDGTGSASYNVATAHVGGVIGDDRDNAITAVGMYKRDVSLSGGKGNDVLTGGDRNDILNGDAGADQLNGGSGNDVLFFDASDTAVLGGQGYDTAIAQGTASVTLDLVASGLEAAQGTKAADHFNGGMHNSNIAVSLEGKAGNDTLLGSGSDDLLSGGNGNDKLQSSKGDDTLFGGAGNDRLFGHSGDDVMHGENGNDNLFGGWGDDVLIGGKGKDTLQGEGHDDYLDGGEGHDNLDAGEGDDIAKGGTGNDTIKAGSGDDTIDGGAGNDVIHTNWGDDQVKGGVGNDTIHIENGGDKRVVAGDGNDKIHVSNNDAAHEIFGGKGNDTLYLSGSRADYRVDYVRNGAKGINEYRIILEGKQIIHIQDVEKVVFGDGGTQNLSHSNVAQDNSETFHVTTTPWADGAQFNDRNDWTPNEGKALDWWLRAGDDKVKVIGSFADIMRMQSGDDYLNLGAGNDTGLGGSGSDTILGGDGNDSLEGEAGADALAGGNGADLIKGDDGNDTIKGGTGNDTINGGSGKDVISGEAGNDSIDGGVGADSILGGNGNDTIKGADGKDWIDGEAGNDLIYGGDSADTIKGGTGNDTLHGQNGDDVLDGGAGADLIRGGFGNDLIQGGDGKDTLTGAQGADQLSGGAGDDNVRGGDDDDILKGDAGDDRLSGDKGADILEGGAGADTVNGGAGKRDIASYASSDAAVKISLVSKTATGGHATGDVLKNIDGLIGSNHNDTLEGHTGHNQIASGKGNDYVKGHNGHDSLFLGAGNDRGHGGRGHDLIQGDEGNDALYGNAGNDTLGGGFGSDTMNGGVGNDSMSGGVSDNEEDVFVFATGDGDDVITDFENDVDKFEFSGLEFTDLTITGSANGAVIRYGSGDSITIADVAASALTETDFIFT